MPGRHVHTTAWDSWDQWKLGPAQNVRTLIRSALYLYGVRVLYIYMAACRHRRHQHPLCPTLQQSPSLLSISSIRHGTAPQFASSAGASHELATVLQRA